jgi:hypothetical protein
VRRAWRCCDDFRAVPRTNVTLWRKGAWHLFASGP